MDVKTENNGIKKILYIAIAVSLVIALLRPTDIPDTKDKLPSTNCETMGSQGETMGSQGQTEK